MSTTEIDRGVRAKVTLYDEAGNHIDVAGLTVISSDRLACLEKIAEHAGKLAAVLKETASSPTSTEYHKPLRSLTDQLAELKGLRPEAPPASAT